MDPALKSRIFRLPEEERRELALELWNSISEDDIPELSPAWKAEIDRRMAHLKEHPDDVLSWPEVRANIEAQLQELRKD